MSDVIFYFIQVRLRQVPCVFDYDMFSFFLFFFIPPFLFSSAQVGGRSSFSPLTCQLVILSASISVWVWYDIEDLVMKV